MLGEDQVNGEIDFEKFNYRHASWRNHFGKQATTEIEN